MFHAAGVTSPVPLTSWRSAWRCILRPAVTRLMATRDASTCALAAAAAMSNCQAVVPPSCEAKSLAQGIRQLMALAPVMIIRVVSTAQSSDVCLGFYRDCLGLASVLTARQPTSGHGLNSVPAPVATRRTLARRRTELVFTMGKPSELRPQSSQVAYLVPRWLVGLPVSRDCTVRSLDIGMYAKRWQQHD